MKVKTFSKSQYSRLVRLVVVGNLCGAIVSVDMVSQYGASCCISDTICI